MQIRCWGGRGTLDPATVIVPNGIIWNTLHIRVSNIHTYIFDAIKNWKILTGAPTLSGTASETNRKDIFPQFSARAFLSRRRKARSGERFSSPFILHFDVCSSERYDRHERTVNWPKSFAISDIFRSIEMCKHILLYKYECLFVRCSNLQLLIKYQHNLEFCLALI